ncbi:MAG: hypothetical protein LBU38_00075, partial [Propionibacteriaceae bacterium]|nr:hypothetical protein [Propionibacteriaceae bacterium]
LGVADEASEVFDLHAELNIPSTQSGAGVHDIVIGIDASLAETMGSEFLTALGSLTSGFQVLLDENPGLTVNLGAVLIGSAAAPTDMGNPTAISYIDNAAVPLESVATRSLSDTVSAGMDAYYKIQEVRDAAYYLGLPCAAAAPHFGLNPSACGSPSTAANFEQTYPSGTNLQAGVQAAKQMLEASATESANQTFLLWADGGSHWWTNSAGKSVANAWNEAGRFRFSNNADLDHVGTGAGQLSDLAYGKYGPSGAVTPGSSSRFADFIAGEASGIAADTANQLPVDDYVANRNNASRAADFKTLATGLNGYPYTSLEKGLYYLANELQDFQATGRNLAIIGADWNKSVENRYVPTQDFFAWTESVLGANYESFSSVVPNSFTPENLRALEAISGSLAQSILNQFQSANVTQTLDESLWLKPGTHQKRTYLDSMTLQVGSAPAVSPTSITTAGSLVTASFGTEVSGVFPYAVTYDTTNHGVFQWSINVPLPKTQSLSLGYDIEVFRSSVEGEYPVGLGDTDVSYQDAGGQSHTQTIPGADPYFYTVPVAPTTHTVTFFYGSNEIAPAQIVNHGDKVKDPGELDFGDLRAVLNGWSYDSGVFDFNTPVTRDLELRALVSFRNVEECAGPACEAGDEPDDPSESELPLTGSDSLGLGFISIGVAMLGYAARALARRRLER